MNNRELYERLREIYDKMEDSVNRLTSIDVWESGIALGKLERDLLPKLEELVDELYEEVEE